MLDRVGYQQAANATVTGWLRIGSVDKIFYLISFIFSLRRGAGLGAFPSWALLSYAGFVVANHMAKSNAYLYKQTYQLRLLRYLE